MSKAELARKLIQKFPHTSKKELGKILYTENPILFSSQEDARNSVRRVTGAGGLLNKKSHKQSDAYKGPLSIPKGELNDFSHYVIRGKNILILSDIHLPYHDFDALSLAINEGKKKKVDTVLLNGDIIDCYQLSSFVTDPKARNFKYEVEMLCHFLEDARNAFPKAKIIYKLGNHEERWERLIMQKAPMIWGFECFELDNLIRIEYLRVIGKPLEVDFVNHKRIVEAGNLSIVHGHEWREGAFSPVNPAKGYFNRALASVLGGDKHRVSEHPDKDINGKVMGGWSTGCLCDLHPRYMPLNKWQLGFARVEVYKGGTFQVYNHKIVEDRLV